MAAEIAGDPIMDLTAPDGSGGGDAAWAAVHAAQLAMPGVLPTADDLPMDPAPWEIDFSADGSPPVEALDDIVFLAGDDAAIPADMVADAPMLLADAAMLVEPALDAPALDAPAPWEIPAEALADAPFEEAADAPPADHWLDGFDPDAPADEAAMPSFAADVVWFADDPVADSAADPDPPSALAPVSEIVVDFAALPETGPVDVADLLHGFGHAPPDEADLPGADEFALLAAWPMPPPDGVETEPWPG